MFALTATAMLLPSCSNDDIDIQTGDATVTLSATLPESLQTRTFGDGLKAKNLQMVVLEAGNDGITGGNLGVFDGGATVYKTTFANGSLTTNVPVKLVTGKKYAVICWSDAGSASPYEYDAVNHKVKADYTGFTTSDDNLDAFYAYQTFTVEGDGTQTIQLRRPFAQLNIGTDDLAAAKAAGFTATTAEVTVPVSTKLDLVKGEVNEPKATTFAAKAIPTGETFPTSAGTDYQYLAMNYVLTGADKSLVDVSLTVNGVNGNPISHTFNTVPVQRNYRTNIYGSILTNAVNVQVEIVPDFDGMYNYDATKLVRDLAAGGDITLPTDVEMRSTGFVGEGTTSTLDLNGKTIFNTNDVWDKSTTIDGVTEPNWSLLSAKTGTLTINGDGKVEAKANDCFAADVRDGGKLVINGGHYVGNIHAVYVYEGELEVNGGTFEVIQKYPDAAKADEFVLNCYDKNRADGKAKITVKGGKFINFNPADCYAEGEHTNFVAEGYVSVGKVDENGTVYYEVVKATTFATSGSEFFNALKTSGNIIGINQDITITAYTTVDYPNTSIILSDGASVVADIKRTSAITVCGGSSTINGKLTLNGYGKFVGPSNKTSGNLNTAAIKNEKGVLNIYGNITFDGGSGNEINNAVFCYSGTTNIYGGYFYTGLDKGGKANACILVDAYTAPSSIAKAVCNIYGGVFEAANPQYLLNIQDDVREHCTLKVYGGTFVGFDPANNTADGANTNFVAPGYKSVKTTYKGKDAWKVVKQ